jgi:restriction system protein
MSTSRRKQPDPYRQQQAAAREAERRRKEAERQRAAAQKEEARQHRERRAAQVQEMNAEVTATVDRLQSILRHGLKRSARIDLEAQRRRPHVAVLEFGSLSAPVPRPVWNDFAPKPPGMLSRALGGNARYERRLEECRVNYERALEDVQTKETERQERVADIRRDHASRTQLAQEEAQSTTRISIGASTGCVGAHQPMSRRTCGKC